MLLVVPYDPTWPLPFEAASAEILAVADHPFLRPEHIGSTSVPGLAAKPTIDMMASVRRLPDGHAAQPALAALGYELAGTGMRERLVLPASGRPRRLQGRSMPSSQSASLNSGVADRASSASVTQARQLLERHRDGSHLHLTS